MATVIERIVSFNSNRNPEMVMLKYTVMRENSFRFLRGTCHLFYEDLASAQLTMPAPSAWLCGDLHLENFGSYKGSDREVYFDLNDFDEAILGSAWMDPVRLLTSIAIAGNNASFTKEYVTSLHQWFLQGYAGTLCSGKPMTCEEGTASGIIGSLFKNVVDRKEKKLVKERTTIKSDFKKLSIDNKRLFPLADKEKAIVISHVQQWLNANYKKGKRKILDAAYLVAGTGSIGIRRYLTLIEDPERDKTYLLVIKQGLPSSLAPFISLQQPVWANDALRITGSQEMMQHVSPGGTGTLTIENNWYFTRWIQPEADKIGFDIFIKEKKEHAGLMQTLGRLAASAQLRSSGHYHSSTADELIAWGQDHTWQDRLLDIAGKMIKQTEDNFVAYCKDYDANYFNNLKKKK